MQTGTITTRRTGRPRTRLASCGPVVAWVSDWIDAEGLSVSDAAVRLGVRQGTLSDWLRGAKNPGIDAITALVKIGMPSEIYMEHVTQTAEKRLALGR